MFCVKTFWKNCYWLNYCTKICYIYTQRRICTPLRDNLVLHTPKNQFSLIRCCKLDSGLPKKNDMMSSRINLLYNLCLLQLLQINNLKNRSYHAYLIKGYIFSGLRSEFQPFENKNFHYTNFPRYS